MTHFILRAYLAIARGERFTGDGYSVETADLHSLRALEIDELTPATIEYRQDERLTRAILEARGIDADEQYRLGITATPSRLQNKFICADLVKRFGLELVTNCPHFNGEGVLQYERKHDFIFPVKKGNRIERFAFYTLSAMRNWERKRNAA